MNCANCNNPVLDQAKYCGRCGSKITKQETKYQPKNESYFISRWKILISLFLKLGFVDSLLYGFFVFLGFVVIEIVASLFGYCITAKSAECIGGFADIFALPTVFGIFYFLYGSWQAIVNLFFMLSYNEEVKEYFGINQDESKKLDKYMFTRGIHTFFLPRYALYISIITITYLVTKNISSAITTLVFVGTLLDIRVLKYLTNLLNSAKTNKTTDNGAEEQTSTQHAQTNTSSDHVNKSLGVTKIIKKMLKAAMWTILISFVLLVILIIWASMTTPA